MQPTDDLKKATRQGALSSAKVIRALLEGPCTAQEMREVSGLHIHTIHEFMRALRKENVVHICGWEEDTAGRESFRVYKLGSGTDKPRRKKSKKQVMQELRERKKRTLLDTAMAINMAKAKEDQKLNGPPRGRGRPKKEAPTLDTKAPRKPRVRTRFFADSIEIE